MKKVLILAYDFPPYISVGGLRPYNWYKYFKEFGIDPIIVTKQWDKESLGEVGYIAPGYESEIEIEENEYGTIVKAPYFPNFPNRLYLKYGPVKHKTLRKVCSLFFEITQFLWVSGPKKELYKAADEVLKKQKIDAIIATGEPFVLHHFASKLSSKHKVPWIADYRDPWSFGMGMENFIYRYWNRFIEKKTLKNVTFITTVNNTFLNNIKSITQKNIYILPNGYDPEFITNLQPKQKSNKTLTISFIGTIQQWNPIELFLTILNQFVIQNGKESILLNLYGINNPQLIQSLIDKKFVNLKEVVNITPRLPNEEVLTLAAKSDLLLLFNYYAVIGTKIYDYIGLKIPILFCFSNDQQALLLRDKHFDMKDYKGMDFDVQEKLIKNKNAGFIVQDTEHLLEILNNCLIEFNQTGKIKSQTKDSGEFSRKTHTNEFAKLILDIKSV